MTVCQPAVMEKQTGGHAQVFTVSLFKSHDIKLGFQLDENSPQDQLEPASGRVDHATA